jgi:putative MFS transporter
VSTFLLPIIVQHYGVSTALGACVVVMVIGGVVCQVWAPETGNVPLDAVGEESDARPVLSPA